MKDAVSFMEEIQRAEEYNPVFRAKLEEAFTPAMKSFFKLLLNNSDDKLKSIGMTDFTNPTAIQNGLRAQGIAAGLAEAVELICQKLAETEEDENDDN